LLPVFDASRRYPKRDERPPEAEPHLSAWASNIWSSLSTAEQVERTLEPMDGLALDPGRPQSGKVAPATGR
jgi:hypothetical protein